MTDYSTLQVDSGHSVPVNTPQGFTSTVQNVSGSTIYYGGPQVSATNNTGSILVGQNAQFTVPTVWLISASSSDVLVSNTQTTVLSGSQSNTFASLGVYGSSYGTEQGIQGNGGAQTPGAGRRGFGWPMRLAAALGTTRLFNPAVGGGNAAMPTWLTSTTSGGANSAQYPYLQGIAGQILQKIAVGGPGGSWPSASPAPGNPYDFYQSAECPAAINAMVWGINEPAAYGSAYINVHIWALRYAIEALIAGAYGAYNDASLAYNGGSNVSDTVKGLGPGYKLHTAADNGKTITLSGGPLNASWPGTSDISFMFLARQDCVATVSATVDGSPVNLIQKGVSAPTQGIVGGTNANPNSIQWLQVQATGGSWTPAIGGVNGTSVAFNATPAQVQASLRTIAGYGSVNVNSPTNVLWGTVNYVPGQAYKVTMTGATMPVPNITVGVNSLTGGAAAVTITDNQWGYQMVTIPASSLPAGAHTVVLTLTIGAGQLGANGFCIRAINPPQVLVPNINRIPAAGYAIYAIAGYPFTINDALVNTYNAALAPGGVPFTNEWSTINGQVSNAVNFVDMDTQVGGAGGNQTLLSNDSLHGNNAGHAEIARAFLKAIPGVTSSQLARIHYTTGVDAGWQTPAYSASNNWAGQTGNVILFVNNQTLRYRKDPSTNLVYLQGACVRTSGTPANLELMFTLQPGYLPENAIIINVRTDAGFSTVGINPVTTGAIFLNPTGFANPTASTGYVWFDAVWYAAA
jgi:hypothetical protein